MNMVIVVLKAFYPPHKTEEIAKIVPELAKKYPPDESIAEAVVRGAGRSTEIGFEGMVIWKVKEGQFDKLITRILGAMSMFKTVEGYRWSIETWATDFEETMIYLKKIQI